MFKICSLNGDVMKVITGSGISEKIIEAGQRAAVFIVCLLIILPGCSSSSGSSSGVITASFTTDVISGVKDLGVVFTDKSTGSVTSRLWDFGDGTASTEDNPEHTYTEAGKYRVTLTVTGTGGTDSMVRENCIIVLSESYPAVDTGVTSFYGDSSLTVAEPFSGEAFYGQDANYTGNIPSYQDNGDGTVTDLNTGLMWQSDRESGTRVTWDDAADGASLCRTGGYSDWRMPDIKELYSLILFTGKSGGTDAQCIPYIDTDFFDIRFGDQDSADLRVIDGQDWSSTKYDDKTMENDETIFGVNFIDGRIKGYPRYKSGGTSENTMYVRYVRGNPEYGKNKFTGNGDTVSDSATGLMWSKADSGSGMGWETALAWVQTKNSENYLGYSDWRLPDPKELHTIVDYSKSPATADSAAIDTDYFECTNISAVDGEFEYPYFWTGTTHLEGGGAVYFSFGRALGYMLTGSFYTLYDVHGAGSQRSDPKTGSAGDSDNDGVDDSGYLLGNDFEGNPVYGFGPQGDVVRVVNYVRLVRDI